MTVAKVAFTVARSRGLAAFRMAAASLIES